LFLKNYYSISYSFSVEDDDGTKISRNLADYVIQTGNKINLADAYSDPRFDPVVDSVWMHKTKAILCMPIKNRDNEIIGCAQVANRLDNHQFDENDEQLFQAFCIFCGLGKCA
jgi:dual 3',5'-cyclic-AMP and -GMP phosphodiesterase 11